MPSVDIGRVCVKLIGREAGRKCVIVDVIDKNFTLITGPKELTGVRRRRANVEHLEPLPEQVEIKRGAADKDVEKAISKAHLTSLMKGKLLPSARPASTATKPEDKEEKSLSKAPPKRPRKKST